MVEGAPHTAKERSVDQLIYHGVPPAPVYKEARGGGPAKEEEARPRGAIVLQVGFPPLSKSY